MRANWKSISKPESSIATTILSGLPQPALIILAAFNLGPKAVNIALAVNQHTSTATHFSYLARFFVKLLAK